MTNASQPKRIALFSDGTGNSSAKAQKTNVWRLFQAVDQTGPDQIAQYDDGVGTSSNKYLAALGGAFGWGLKRNVIELYKFVCRNYVKGDEIYGFGFSRGAFTIRVLVGLIVREGLVTFRSEAELDHRAAAAYRHFRYLAFPSKSPLIWLFRKLRDFLLALRNKALGRLSYHSIAADTRTAQRDVIPIRFLGLWDTVEAYGMPIAALKRGIDWLLWPMLFGDMKLASCVKRAVHALSLDDERTTFHPLLWDELWEAQLAAEDPAGAGRITQAWFAGVHSNVGGGYPEDQLSLVPLEWIMSEAAHNGLSLIANQAMELAAAQSAYARHYDSRAGLASYYRYSPREVPVLRYAGTPILANVHWSVVMRMGYGSDSYVPITLPHTFKVLLPGGAMLPLDDLVRSLRQDPPYTTGYAQLDSALLELGSPDAEQVGRVWDTVFWRSSLYLLTMALTLLAAAFPWFSKLLPQILADWERAAGGPIAAVVDAFSALIPSFMTPWKQSLKVYPLEFGILLIAIVLSLIGSQTLAGRIHDRARLIWHTGPIDKYRQWRQQSSREFVRLMIVGMLLLAAAALICLLIGIPHVLATLAVTAAVLLLASGVSIISAKRRAQPASTRVRNTVAMKAARLLRKNPVLVALYSALTQRLIPVLFAISLVIAGLILINRASFDIFSSAGLYCTGSANIGPGEPVEQLGDSSGTFSTHDTCWASGLVLKQGHRYLITITTNTNPATNRWFDRDVPTDVLGFPTDSPRHWLARPLTRWWNQNWFKPIARIGRFGNDEYVLDPIDDIAPLPKQACLAAYRSPQNLPPFKPIGTDLAQTLNHCAAVPTDRLVLHSEIKAQYDGELFLYVNDAIIGVPGLPAIFYKNNSGTGTVRVDRLTSRAIQTEPPSAR